MSDDPRDPVIHDAIRSFNEVDVEGLMSFVHPEITSRVAEGLGNVGEFEGPGGFATMMAEWGEAWAEQSVALNEIEHLDERTSLVHTRQSLVGAGSGVPIEMETTYLVVFDGVRAIRFEIHASRESALEAL